MELTEFQKGKFYELPIKEIVSEGDTSYFKVLANGKEYLIRMFEFQRHDSSLEKLKELPCMVKDVHGDNIVFVQNFARMFGKDYDPESLYPFTVTRQINVLPDGRRYYDIHDSRGVMFRLKTDSDVYLQPHQRISCRVHSSSPNKLEVEYVSERRRRELKCVTPSEFLSHSGLDTSSQRLLERLFLTKDIFAEARGYLERFDDEWVVKALLAVPGLWEWGSGMRTGSQRRLVDMYLRISLHLLEESKLLMDFSDAERGDFQEKIADGIEASEVYGEVIRLVENNGQAEMIDSILHKLRNSGFIYHAEEKMSLLIAIFSMFPSLLEERIDAILDIISDTTWSRRNSTFRKAFRLLLLYYIRTNRERVDRVAFVEDGRSELLLNRMVKAISYLLLMTEGDDVDVPLCKSVLYHYLSFVRSRKQLGSPGRDKDLSDSLVERSFQALMSSDNTNLEFGWGEEIGRTELFAYRMSVRSLQAPVLTTRSFESEGVRFTVGNDRITISSTSSSDNDRNVLPKGVLPWHDMQIYLENYNKFQISASDRLGKWKDWWKKVEKALFEPQKSVAPVVRKLRPEVGNDVMIRVLRRDGEYRYYCRIEDDSHYGEGWIDVYGKGATTGLFHYDPMFDLSSFYDGVSPLLFKARINAVVDADAETPLYMFDAMGYIDQFVKENCGYGDKCDCKMIYHDEANHVMIGVTEHGYSVFVPDKSEGHQYVVGDTMKIQVCDAGVPRRIQAEIYGLPDKEVNVKDAADSLLYSYCDGLTYQESADELAEKAMSVSEDQFEIPHIRQLINILDHKAVLEPERVSAYGYLAVASILARMSGEDEVVRYLRQRQRMLCVLEDFGRNGKIDENVLQELSEDNADQIERDSRLKEMLCQIKIVDSIGKQENNEYLWALTSEYNAGQLIGKLSRLMLSYNLADGNGLQALRDGILDQIRKLLNISVKLPKIYSFGEEDQLTEFKSSIVYPPNNGMKPDLKRQTSNILKIINGMVNAYGGTLYLGVYDTGTAKGLEDDDLPIFENSQDKYKLYVRNQIRLSMGAMVNAGIVEECPEAGEHWIYAIRVRPAKAPVVMKYEGEEHYYFREGSSTYPYEDVEELRRVMDERRFKDYDVSEADMMAEVMEEETEAREEAHQEKETAKKRSFEDNHSNVTTSRWRTNIINNWEEGYNINTAGFFRLNSPGSWSLLDDVPYEDGLLTVALTEEERRGSLVLAYPDGEVQRVAMADILKAEPGKYKKMRKERVPMFICPASEKAALLTIYEDDNSRRFIRLDDVANLKIGKITEEGATVTDQPVARIVAAEIIPAEGHDKLDKIHNPSRKQTGWPLATILSTIPDVGMELAKYGLTDL